MFSIRKQALSYLLLATILSITSTASPIRNLTPGSPPNWNSSSGSGPPDQSGEGCTAVTYIVTVTAATAVATYTPVAITSVAPFSTPTTVARLPSTGTNTDLPSTNNTVKFVAIGRGIQNYTCSAVGATPVALGAIAVLFDYTSIANSNESELNTFPSIAANVPFDPFTPTPTSLAGLPAATVLGHHFFAADTTPTFNLTGAPATNGGNMILFGAKTASVNAPVGAPLGPDGTGAVAWLQLEAKTTVATEASVDIKEAYRVETAGGNPETLCSSVGVQTIPYAAEYWFFD